MQFIAWQNAKDQLPQYHVCVIINFLRFLLWQQDYGYVQLSSTDKLKPYIQNEPVTLRSPDSQAPGLVSKSTSVHIIKVATAAINMIVRTIMSLCKWYTAADEFVIDPKFFQADRWIELGLYTNNNVIIIWLIYIGLILV